MMTLSKNRRLVLILSAVPVLLMIPLIAMQFTSEVQWSAFDFLVMGVLLTLTGLLIEIAIRNVKQPGDRLHVVLTIIVIFILVWMELALGIFGSPWAGQ